MGPKRKRSSSSRSSPTKRSSSRKSTAKDEKSDNKPTTNSKDRKDIKKRPTKTKGSDKVKYDVGEEIEYDPVHQGSTRRAQGKVTKVLTGAKVKFKLNFFCFIYKFSFRNLIHQQKKFVMLLKMIILEKRQVCFFSFQINEYNYLSIFFSIVYGQHSVKKKAKK